MHLIMGLIPGMPVWDIGSSLEKEKCFSLWGMGTEAFLNTWAQQRGPVEYLAWDPLALHLAGPSGEQFEMEKVSERSAKPGWLYCLERQTWIEKLYNQILTELKLWGGGLNKLPHFLTGLLLRMTWGRGCTLYTILSSLKKEVIQQWNQLPREAVTPPPPTGSLQTAARQLSRTLFS